MPLQSSVRALKKPLRLDDEVRFLRSWIEKPLHMGAVMPSGRVLARTMAQYVDIELHRAGRRARPRHRGDHQRADRARRRSEAPGAGRIQSGFLRAAARPLSAAPRWCRAMPMRCATSLRNVLSAPASAVVSGLPLVTKPMLTRLKLIRDAFVRARARARRSCSSPIRLRRRFRNRCRACPQKPPSGSG